MYDRSQEIIITKLKAKIIDLKAEITCLQSEKEQVCEWIEDENGCFTTIHETGVIAPENHEWKFCPDCGKRIKYVEEE